MEVRDVSKALAIDDSPVTNQGSWQVLFRQKRRKVGSVKDSKPHPRLVQKSDKCHRARHAEKLIFFAWGKTPLYPFMIALGNKR